MSGNLSFTVLLLRTNVHNLCQVLSGLAVVRSALKMPFILSISGMKISSIHPYSVANAFAMWCIFAVLSCMHQVFIIFCDTSSSYCLITHCAQDDFPSILYMQY